MADTVQITVTDAMRGTYNDDGSIAEWPAVDVLNRPYERQNATKQRIGDKAFVVIPPGRAESIEIVQPGAARLDAPAKASKKAE